METENTIVCDENGTRWVRTGDLGYIDEDGFVFVTGRLKRIYSTRAEKNGFFIIKDSKTFEAVISSDKVDYRALEYQAEQ